MRIIPEHPLQAALLKVVAIAVAGAFFLSACSRTPQPQEISSPTEFIPFTGDIVGTVESATELLFTATPSSVIQVVALPTGLISPNCTYSAYYWITYPERWLADNIVIGRLAFTKSDALSIMNSQIPDDITITLQQFFAAALNILNGADSKDIEAEMIRASDWLNKHPPGIELTDSVLQEGLLLAERLMAFNGGEIGPGPCEDEPSTPTPSATATPTLTATATRGSNLFQLSPTATERQRSGPGGGVSPSATSAGTTQVPPATTAATAPATSPATQPAATNTPAPPPTQVEEPTPTVAPSETPVPIPPTQLPTPPPLPTFP